MKKQIFTLVLLGLLCSVGMWADNYYIVSAKSNVPLTAGSCSTTQLLKSDGSSVSATTDISSSLTGTGSIYYNSTSASYAELTKTSNYTTGSSDKKTIQGIKIEANATMTISLGSKTFSKIDVIYTCASNNSCTLTIDGTECSTSDKNIHIESITESFSTSIAIVGDANKEYRVIVILTEPAVDPTITFISGSYNIGGDALDLSSLFTSNSTGTVTYSVKTDGGTEASIDGTSFTATTAGTATVLASQAATSSYNSKTVETTITVNQVAPAAPSFDPVSGETVEQGSSITILSTYSTSIKYKWTATESEPDEWDTYSSSVTVPNETGTRYLYAYGSNDAGNGTVSHATYTLIAPKTPSSLLFETPKTSIGVAESVTNVATVTVGPGDATITYSSDDASIASVNAETGEVTGVAVGTTTIRANYAGNVEYLASTTSYSITVNQSAVNTHFWTSGAFLTAVGGSATDVTNENSPLYIDNMEIVGSSTALKIATGSNKTIDGKTVGGRVRFGKAGSADGNYLHFKIKPNTKITFWGIRATEGAESNGLALSIGSFGANEKVYSFAAGDVESFSYYYSGTENTDVYAYSKNASGASMMAIKVETVTTVSIAPSHDKITYVTTEKLDFTDAIGLNAYRVSAAAGGLVTIDEVGEVPASTPLLLIGTADNTYNIPVIASAGAIGTNMLRAGDGSTLFDGTTYDYLLYSDGLFYQIGSGTIATNKAYLHCDTDPTAAGAPGLRIIEEENTATNIEAVEANEKVVKFIKNGQMYIKRDNVVYDAMGRVIR